MGVPYHREYKHFVEKCLFCGESFWAKMPTTRYCYKDKCQEGRIYKKRKEREEKKQLLTKK